MINPEMPQTEPDENRVLRFEELFDQLDNFPDKDKAQELFGLYRNAQSISPLETYNAGAQLVQEKEDEASRLCQENERSAVKSQTRQKLAQCKLFHLIAGSSLEASQWALLPLDTPDGIFESFIRKDLSRIEPRR